MTIKIFEKPRPGESTELVTYESNFIPSVGDIIGASSFPDREQRVVIERMIIPVSESVILYCTPPKFPYKG